MNLSYVIIANHCRLQQKCIKNLIVFIFKTELIYTLVNYSVEIKKKLEYKKRRI